MALQNVNIFHDKLVPTGLKVELPQYELEIRVEGVAVDAGRQVPKSKQQRVLWPDVFERLPQEEQEEIIRDVLIRYARADTEISAAPKEG